MRYEVKGELGDLPGYKGPPDAPIVFLWVYDLIDVLVYDFVYQLFIDYSHSCFFCLVMYSAMVTIETKSTVWMLYRTVAFMDPTVQSWKTVWS